MPAVAACFEHVGLQLGDLVRLDGHGNRPGTFEVAVEPELPHRLLDLVEILHAQPVELLELVREAAGAVLLPVREGRLAEAAVATGCRPADRARLQQGDARRGVALLGLERRPQPEEPATDDDEVVVRDVVVPGPGGCATTIRPDVVEPECREPRSFERRRDDALIGNDALEDSGFHARRPCRCAGCLVKPPYSSSASSLGSSSSLALSSSTLTSLKVSTRTDLTKRSER